MLDKNPDQENRPEYKAENVHFYIQMSLIEELLVARQQYASALGCTDDREYWDHKYRDVNEDDLENGFDELTGWS
eukprot:g28281.t1